MERIEAELLIPGTGEPVRDGVVVVDGELIHYAGPAADAPVGDDEAVVRAPVVMPGLWDCHAHFLGISTLDLNLLALQPAPLRAARSTRDLQVALDAGVTSVREVGGLGVSLAQAVNEGTLSGPRIYPAGAVLSSTGGHADLHSFPTAWIADFGAHGGDLRVCDGVDDCVRAVREQLRRDAKVIKICASGGVMSEVDDPHHQLFTHRELAAIVETAALSERVVAAHCHGKAGILAALEAGARTIEHGTYLDEECCAAMKETGAVLVPTRTVVEALHNTADLPPFALDKIRRVGEQHIQSVTLAHESGVTIAMGTDITLTAGSPLNSWGHNGAELAYLVDAGLSPLEAIRAATVHGPDTLGPQAPHSGQLAAGYDADVITLDANPLTDISVIADPRNVSGVWVLGQRVKGMADTAA
ncbi:MAG: metal-dependent hydrolase family protein [Myxococcota bacterium]